jgi:hypothetical protein
MIEIRGCIPISDAFRTLAPSPSDSLTLSLTNISTLQSSHRTLSWPWQTQPRLAHSTSLTFAGFGVQSVTDLKDSRRLRKAARSHGAYFGASVRAGAAEARDKDLLCAMLAVFVDEVEVGSTREVISLRAEVGRLIRRRLSSLSAGSTFGPLFTPDFKGKDEVDLFPKLLNNALNFLFEAFIAASF